MLALNIEEFDADEYDRLAAKANTIYELIESGGIQAWTDTAKQTIRECMAYQVGFQIVDEKKGLCRLVDLMALEEGIDFQFTYDNEGKPVVLAP